ncbi:hypothetical protein SARC_10124, partial [Sphaeroforma arctica JP610]
MKLSLRLLDDSDPFNEVYPGKSVSFDFEEGVVIGDYLEAIVALVKCPREIGDVTLQVQRDNQYLDNDYPIDGQNDDIVLKAHRTILVRLSSDARARKCI